MASMDERISSAIEDRRDDLVSLTVDLIRFPTINPPGDAYTPCAEFLAGRMKQSGFASEFIRGVDTPGDTDKYPRTNVVCRREGRSPGSTVHFNSHIDVVVAGDEWTMDPFRGAVMDGRVFGRGACDMKGGLAASVIAVEAFLAVYPDHPGAIEVSGTVDEESGGFGGVAYLAGKGLFSRPRVDHVIIPEPLNKDRICLGYRIALPRRLPPASLAQAPNPADRRRYPGPKPPRAPNCPLQPHQEHNPEDHPNRPVTCSCIHILCESRSAHQAMPVNPLNKTDCVKLALRA